MNMSTIFWFIGRNLRLRWLPTTLTAAIVAVAVALTLVVPMLSRQIENGAAQAAQIYPLLVTARGNSTQAVLSSLYYLDVPIGNLPYSQWLKYRQDPRVKLAIPLGFGDRYLGFPIVGTSTDFFKLKTSPQAADYFRFSQGSYFKQAFDVVLGATVAKQAGLQMGDTFRSSHGLTENRALAAEEEHADAEEHADEHAQSYTVRGILAATGGPTDRAIFTPMDSLWETHGQYTPASRGITALLLSGKRIVDVYTLAQTVNTDPLSMAVFPGQVYGQLRGFLLQGQQAYQGLSILILLLGALTVWLSVFAGALERQKLSAHLRLMGASPRLVFGIVLGETVSIVCLGVIAGIALAYVSSFGLSALLAAQLGFSLPTPSLDWAWLGMVSLLIPLGILAALVPSWQTAKQSPLAQR